MEDGAGEGRSEEGPTDGGARVSREVREAGGKRESRGPEAKQFAPGRSPALPRSRPAAAPADACAVTSPRSVRSLRTSSSSHQSGRLA